MQRSIPLFLTKFILPNPLRGALLDAFRHERIVLGVCSQHSQRCGALAKYQSKLLAPYSIEDDRFFRRLEVVPFSDIVRFTWPTRSHG